MNQCNCVTIKGECGAMQENDQSANNSYIAHVNYRSTELTSV